MGQRESIPARARIPCLALGFVTLCLAMAGCGGQQATAPQTTKRYALKGTVLSVDRAQERLIVDHEAIPDFMAAMAMPYPVADPQLLDVAGPGDEITADVALRNSPPFPGTPSGACTQRLTWQDGTSSATWRCPVLRR